MTALENRCKFGRKLTITNKEWYLKSYDEKADVSENGKVSFFLCRFFMFSIVQFRFGHFGAVRQEQKSETIY